jgi:hypothetical protein
MCQRAKDTPRDRPGRCRPLLAERDQPVPPTSYFLFRSLHGLSALAYSASHPAVMGLEFRKESQSPRDTPWTRHRSGVLAYSTSQVVLSGDALPFERLCSMMAFSHCRATQGVMSPFPIAKQAQMPLYGSGGDENGRLALIWPIISCPTSAIFKVRSQCASRSRTAPRRAGTVGTPLGHCLPTTARRAAWYHVSCYPGSARDQAEGTR